MTRHIPLLARDATMGPTLLVEAARCWREARDGGHPVLPSLSRMLDPHGCALLAPALESLCLFYEHALGRPLTVGEALALSDDEHLLLGLVDGSVEQECLDCPEVTPLDCALCSTRILLALAFDERPTLQ